MILTGCCGTYFHRLSERFFFFFFQRFIKNLDLLDEDYAVADKYSGISL